MINEFGDVLSLKRGIILSPYINNKGYKMIDLSNKYKKDRYLIHRLVAIHFVPNPNNYPIVLHKDNNKLNTHYSNLKWGTYSENNSQAIRDGLNSVPIPDNRVEYEIYNDYERIFCIGAKEVINKLEYGNDCTIRNLLFRNSIVKQGPYEGSRVRKKVVLNPIIYFNKTNVQRSAPDGSGNMP